MKRIFRYIAATALACGALSCTEFEEFNNDTYIPAPGEKIKLTLNATRGGSDVDPDTRVYVGQIVGNKVRYYWNEGDQIGVIPLTITDAKPNYVTSETAINAGDKNLAQFEAYIEAEGYETSQQHLLIYYPYNSSMLEGTTGSTGQAYAKQGLTFRLPQVQEQYGYGKTFVGENVDQSKEHPSVWAISRYGLAYDLAGTAFSSETEGSQVIANATGEFQLDHANTYFQFNVYGTQSSVSGKDYGDGTWKLSSVTLEAGHCELTTDDEGNTIYSLSDQIALAGTYKFSYEYNSGDFANVGGVNNNSAIKLNTVAGLNSVRVNMNNVESAPALGGTTATSVPAFVVLNGMQIKSNPKGSLNALKVSVTCFKYDESGNVVGSDTRVRYYNIGDIVGKDLAGNYYTIDFEVCDPVESYTDLSVAGNANCYIVSAPGNYSFNLDVAGNGKAPYGGFTAGINPTDLIQGTSLDEINNKYGFDWLWASGLSFDKITGVTGDVNIVKKIVNSVAFTGDTGKVSIGLNDSAENLSGNIVFALYEKNTDGSVKKIIWTWHLWLGRPQTQHYKFASTNYNWNYTNEDWYILDRNVGAESAEFTTVGDPNGARSTGLYYQRGRKEPMIGFNSANGSSDWNANQLPTYRNTETFGSLATWKANVAYNSYNTFSQPMSLIRDIPYTTDYVSNPSADYTFAWNSSSTAVDNENDINNDTKSMFDPCPVGYRMPTTREWDNMKADKYRYTVGGQGFGVYGYCVWEGLESRLSSASTDERVITYLEHLSTDRYTVNDQYERTYYVNANSGTGSEIITYFPNTGTLNHSGEWHDTYEGSWSVDIPGVLVQHAAGPQLSAEIVSTTSVAAPNISRVDWGRDNSYGTITMGQSGTYYYSVGEDNPATTLTITTTNNGQITVSATNSGNSQNTVYIGNMTNGTSKTVYFYNKVNGQVSEPSTLTVSRQQGNGRHSAARSNGNTSGGTSHILNVTFAESGAYSYATSANGTKTQIAGSTFSISCSNLSFSYGSSTLYFYCTDDNGIISAATTLQVSRSGSYGSYSYDDEAPQVGEAYTETVGGGTEQYTETANMVLWSSGRVGETANAQGYRKYSQYWFGPASGTTDGWASEKNGDWGHSDNNGKATAPYTESRETYLFGVDVYSLGTYDNNAKEGLALPVRCIREYDNVSTSTVNE